MGMDELQPERQVGSKKTFIQKILQFLTEGSHVPANTGCPLQ